MKFIIISLGIVAQLLFIVYAAPMPQSQVAQLTSQSAPITVQSVDGGIAFTQNFMQLFSSMFHSFNTIVPRFINLFTGQNPAAPGAPSNALPGLPSLPNIPSIPSLPSIQASSVGRSQPEKINIVPNVTFQSPKKDIELIENDIDDKLSN